MSDSRPVPKKVYLEESGIGGSPKINFLSIWGKVVITKRNQKLYSQSEVEHGCLERGEIGPIGPLYCCI